MDLWANASPEARLIAAVAMQAQRDVAADVIRDEVGGKWRAVSKKRANEIRRDAQEFLEWVRDYLDAEHEH